ncbi:MAG: formate/nitrite transporter family protein [Beijerinckiaceae bacterium]|nr:MAG: formate/nitrite transporter family protein [Beijerinckiaceae bacterium]
MKTSKSDTRAQPQKDLEPVVAVSQREIEDIEERSSPRTPVIYEIVRRLGEEEMARPVASLWWSGVAAGLSISFSLVAQALFEAYLPEAPWRHLVTSLGYCVGFIIVVLARQQLFTEITITAVLPLFATFTSRNVRKLTRLWSIVLIANFAGTMVAALFYTYVPAVSPALHNAMLEVSSGLLGQSALETFVKGIPAGFLIAAMVWLIPSADTAQFHVISITTYVIAAAGFMHIIAGSVEAFFLALNGAAGWDFVFGGFIVPVLFGNIIGGTALFSLISYGQVMHEIKG